MRTLSTGNNDEQFYQKMHAIKQFLTLLFKIADKVSFKYEICKKCIQFQCHLTPKQASRNRIPSE